MRIRLLGGAPLATFRLQCNRHGLADGEHLPKLPLVVALILLQPMDVNWASEADMRSKTFVVVGFSLVLTTMVFAQAQTVPFHGEAKQSGKNYSLSADGAELRASSKAVDVKDGSVSVKVGAKLKIVHTAKGIGILKNDDACPNRGPTFCAGLVEACCGNGKVLRACLGAWGCP
jgi:hypothetical protein